MKSVVKGAIFVLLVVVGILATWIYVVLFFLLYGGFIWFLHWNAHRTPRHLRTKT